MTRCGHCGEPVHPHQMTCGSCGAALRATPDIRDAGSEVRAPDEDGTVEPPAPDDAAPTRGASGKDGPATPGEPAAGEAPGRGLSSPGAEPIAQPARLRSTTARPPGTTSGPMGPSTATRASRRPAAPRPDTAASSPAFFSRAWALVVDAAILAVVSTSLPTVVRIGIRAAEAVMGQPELYDDILTEQLVAVADLALVAGYFVFLTAGTGQTIGKGLMGLHVMRLDGRPPDPLTGFLRLVGYGFSALPLGFGFLLAAFSPRRALHDYLAGTRVVRTRDMPGVASEDGSP